MAKIKDYKKWFELKPQIEAIVTFLDIPPKEGEIWWCMLGRNIGTEIDGKNDFFERPVLVVRVFNPEHILVLPLRSNAPSNKQFTIPVILDGRVGYVLLSQIRAISAKRLKNYMYILQPAIFQEIISRLRNIF